MRTISFGRKGFFSLNIDTVGYLNYFSVLFKHWFDVDWPPECLSVEVDVVFRKDVNVNQVKKMLL